MLPHIILHSMVSVDGRMDLPAPDLGLYYEVASRWEVDAILSGSETILTGFGDPEADAHDAASNSAQEGAVSPSDGPLVIPDLMSPDDVIGARLTHVEDLGNGVVWLRYDVSQ